MIRFTEGWKYQLVGDWSYQLQEEFVILYPESNQYYYLTQQGLIGAHPGCCWDGPTWCPDFKWAMEGSLGHDVLHWLIAKGCLSENQNNRIDKEFENIIRERAPLPPVFGLASLLLYARVARRATNLVNQRRGEFKPVCIVGRFE